MIIDLRDHPLTDGGEKLVRAFDHLLEGGHLVLLTAHEPTEEWQALHDSRPGLFTWNPVRRGPDVWQVWLGRIDPTAIHH